MLDGSRTPLVLVHGGAHGAWCWQPMLPHLRRRALAIDLPPTAIRGVTADVAPPPEVRTTGLREFADAVLTATDQAGLARFALVGHSMGGLTIAEVARRAPERVTGLAFVSCLVPPEGGTVVDALPAAVREMTREAMTRARDEGTFGPGMDEDLKRQMFCNDMDEEQTRFVLERCGHECVAAFLDTVIRTGIPPELPKTYVRLLRDQALDPPTQDEQIANLRASPGGDVTVVELDSGHDAMVSRPRELAALLNTIAP
ncbi:MAG: alpha/beta fold hydrolase [Thermodesulfobacteriota bacterium]